MSTPLRRGDVGSQRLYRSHVEDIAFLFLRRALPLPLGLCLVLTYVVLPPPTFARWRRRFLSDTGPSSLAGCYLANGQMRLVRFTRTRSVTRLICPRSESFSQSRIDHRGFLFLSDRSYQSGYFFSPPHIDINIVLV